MSIVFPLLLPFLLAVISLFGWRRLRFQRVVSLVGAGIILVLNCLVFAEVQRSGILTLNVGNWQPPFGITLVIDSFSAYMLVITGVVALAIAVYAWAGIDSDRVDYGFYPLFFFLLMGVSGAFTTGDLFNLYVWFEVMLMASFVLIALGGERGQVEGAVKYVILNLLSSFLFLSATGLLYNLAGTLNLADLAQRLPRIQPNSQVTLISVLFLIAFGIKSAVFPLFFWLPASYHTAPVTVTALFSALLTKVGVYALIRVFTLLFTQDTAFTQPLILVIAGLTMVTGVLGAAAQMDFRRLLSFHIISQIGYLLMGLGLGSQEALAGSIYFMAHVILSKTALFLVAGLVYQLQGSFDLKKLGGIYQRKPVLAIFFLVPALSLAGLPPLPGFFAKLALIAASLRMGAYTIAAVALIVSLMTLYSMTKIWIEVFWKEPKPADKPPVWQPASAWLWLPVIVMALLVLAYGILAEPAYEFARQAAGNLLTPLGYVQAVLEGQP